MRIEDHCEITLEKFGIDGKVYHKWIDQYFREYGALHRDILHHEEGIEIGIQIFGEICRKILEQHIMDDCGKIPTIQDYRNGDMI